MSLLARGCSEVGLTTHAIHAAADAVKRKGKGVGALVRDLQRDIEQARAMRRFDDVRAWWSGLDQSTRGDFARMYQAEKFGGRMLPGGWMQSAAWWEWAMDNRGRVLPRAAEIGVRA